MQTYFELGQGEGYHRFGAIEKARVHLHRALALAGEHGFNELAFDAQAGIEKLGSPTPAPEVTRPMSLDVEEVAEAIREMRELAGAL
jgi:hypothetical protein